MSLTLWSGTLATVALGLVAGAALAQEHSLEEPRFRAAKPAAAAGSAFPADEAGMSAYAKVGQGIDINKVKTVFSRVEGVGDNYIYGVVLVSNFGGASDIRVYADTDGWLVAYIKNMEPAAKMMQWYPANVTNPEISAIQRNTLTDALEAAGTAAGTGFLEQIQYYNFKYPDADRLTLFIKTVPIGETSSSSTFVKTALAQVTIPTNYTLYEASYYHYAYYSKNYSDNRSEVKVDGVVVSGFGSTGRGDRQEWLVVLDSFRGAIQRGHLHTIEVVNQFDASGAFSRNSGSAGVATALIYRVGE